MSTRAHRVDEHITGDGLGIAAELQGKILVANAARAIDRQDQGDIHRFRRDGPRMMSHNNVVAKHFGRPQCGVRAPGDTRLTTQFALGFISRISISRIG
jgi:hypothetical protein